jgi:Flp pilus assembly protein CpaB
MSRLSLLLRRTRRTVLARRRPLAALCVAVAVAAGLRAATAPPPPTTMVLTAAHDLGAGVVVQPGDLRRRPYPPGSVPAGILRDASAAVGRTTAGPVRAREALTDTRLVTASLLQGYPGLVAVPVRIGDPDAVRLLRVGDRVDLLAADPQGDGLPAQVIGHDVPVVSIPRSSDDSPGLSNGGALVVVGVPDGTAGAVAQAGVSSFLSVVLTR